VDTPLCTRSQNGKAKPWPRRPHRAASSAACVPSSSALDVLLRLLQIFTVLSFAGSGLGWGISFSLCSLILVVLFCCEKLYLLTTSRHWGMAPSVARGIFTRPWPLLLHFSQGSVPCPQVLAALLEREISSPPVWEGSQVPEESC